MRDSLSPLPQLAVVDPKKEIRARQRWLDCESAAKISHCLGNAILELVDQAQIHVNFSKLGDRCQHCLVFLLRGRIVTALLRLLGSFEMSANRRTPGSLGCASLPEQFAHDADQQSKNGE